MALVPNVKLDNVGSINLVATTFSGRKKNETIPFPAGGSIQIAVDAGQSLRITTAPKAVSKPKDASTQPES